MGCLESGGLASYWGSVLEGIRNVGVFLSRRFFHFFVEISVCLEKELEKKYPPKTHWFRLFVTSLIYFSLYMLY